MELEAKYRLETAEQARALLALRTLGAFTLTPSDAPEQQVNTYYDTVDGRLQAARFGLRTRDIDGQLTATLKGPAVAHGAVTSREELEQSVPSADIADWSAGPLLDRLLEVTGGAPLQPTISVQTTRQHLYAARDGQRVAEISVDQGTFYAGTRTAPFHELEVELLSGGDRAAFDALIALLEQHYPLTPEPKSKLQRALELRAEG